MIIETDKKYLQEKLELLLAEVNDICRENDIPCFLIEESLVAAVRGVPLPKNRKVFSVAIYSEDVKRFIELVEPMPQRATESLLNNPLFPGFYLKYVDVNTTLYNVSEVRKKQLYNAIGINICILFNKEKNNGKLNKVDDKRQLLRSKLLGHNGRNLKKSIFLMVNSVAGKLSSQKAFIRYLETYKTSKSRMIFLPNGERLILDESLFGKGIDIEISGHMHKIPEKAETVALRTNKDILSLKKTGNPYAITTRDIVSFTYPGSKYADELKKKKINVQKCAKKYINYQEWRKNKYLPIWRKRTTFYSYYDLVRDRFYLYDRLASDKKAEIISLYNNDQYDELYGILSEYIELLYEYDDRGMGLFFDGEIYVITIKVIEYFINKTEKNERFIQEQIKRLHKNIDKVFWQHLQPVVLFESGNTAAKEDLENIRGSIKKQIIL